jgi:hypothetical protein
LQGKIRENSFYRIFFRNFALSGSQISIPASDADGTLSQDGQELKDGKHG